MFRRVLVAAAGACLLSGCGTDSPIGDDPGFHLGDGDARLGSRYDQETTVDRFRVRVPSGVTRLRLRTDCIAGGGEVEVRVGSLGAGATACGETSSPRGSITYSGKRFEAGAQTVVVHAPDGARWSVAVDAG